MSPHRWRRAPIAKGPANPLSIQESQQTSYTIFRRFPMVNSPHRIEGQSSSAGDAWLEPARAHYCVRAGSFQGSTARTEWRAPLAGAGIGWREKTEKGCGLLN